MALEANPMAVVFGGGTPIDFGRTLGDHERLFGDGKTWRGLVGGTLSGAFLGLLLTVPFNLFAPTSARSSATSRVRSSSGGCTSPAVRKPPSSTSTTSSSGRSS